MRRLALLLLLATPYVTHARPAPPRPIRPCRLDLSSRIDALAGQIEGRVIAWRRHLHDVPGTISNREVETAAYVAAHLRSLGLEVQTGVARNGVVAVLRGGEPGPVVALRADMDALPVTEEVDLPFASKVRRHVQRPQRGRHARVRPRRPHRRC